MDISILCSNAEIRRRLHCYDEEVVFICLALVNEYSIVLYHTRYGRIRSNRSFYWQSSPPDNVYQISSSSLWRLWEFLQHKHISHAALDLFCLKFTPRVNSLTAKLKRFSPTNTLSKAPQPPLPDDFFASK